MGRYLDDDVKQSVAKESDLYEIGLMLTRKTYENKKLKKMAWHYFAAVEFMGRLVSIDFVPKGNNDPSAYDRLDQIFDGQKEIPLYARDFEFENDGEKISGTNFFAFRLIEEYGVSIEFELGLKPSKNSDKALLDFVLARFKAKRQEELEASAEDKPENKTKVKKTE